MLRSFARVKKPTFPIEAVSANRSTGALAGVVRGAKFMAVFFLSAPRVEYGFWRNGEAGARQAFADTSRSLCKLLGISVHVAGTLCPQAKEIRVANHLSYLDILVLGSIEGGRFFSRHDVARWPIVGRVATRIGSVYVDRGSKAGRTAALRALARAAHGSAPFVIFPEGHTAHGELLPFQPGAFLIAQKAGIPIKPIALRYERPQEAAWVGDMPLVPHLWRRLCGNPLCVHVVALAPLAPTQTKNACVMAERARAAIQIALELTTL